MEPQPPRYRGAATLLVAIVLSVLVHIIFGVLLDQYRARFDNSPREAVQYVTLTTLIRLHPTPSPPTPTPEPTVTPAPTPLPTQTPTPPPKTPPPLTPPPQTPVPHTPKPVQPTVAPARAVHPIVAAAHAAPPHLQLNVPHTHGYDPHAATVDHAPGTQDGTAAGHGQAGPGLGLGAGPQGPPVAANPPPETPAACAHPEEKPTTINPVQPEYPEDAQGASGLAFVQVDLSSTGTVLGVSILQSSGSPALDREALAAARRSTYRAAIHNCISIPGSYKFRANFETQ